MIPTKYTNDKLWIVHCYLRRFSIPQHADLTDSMSSLAQSCISIKLLCFKLFFSRSKFYLYMYTCCTAFLQLNLVSRFFNVGNIISVVMPVFSLVVFQF